MAATASAIVIIRHVVVVLKWKGQIDEKISKAHKVRDKLTGNSSFPLPWTSNLPTLVTFSADITLLDNAQAAVKAKTGTTLARNTALENVHGDLRKIQTMVQTAADNNPKNAEDITKNAGFDFKIINIKQKQKNDARNTDVSGTVMLTADGQGAHEWQMSPDQKTITNLPATKQAHTLVSGLTPGQQYYFRNKKIPTKKQQFDWSDWKQLIAQ